MLFIFKVITDRSTKLGILQILKKYLQLPPKALFAQELADVLQHIINHATDRAVYEHEYAFEIPFLEYLSFVPISHLLPELINKFVITPYLAYGEEGLDRNEFTRNISDAELQSR